MDKNFINTFNNSNRCELQPESFSYLDSTEVKVDTFTEVVEELVKELGACKLKEISVLLATALVKKGADKAEISSSYLYQVWYQNCNKLFVDKYGPNTPPEPPTTPSLALAA